MKNMAESFTIISELMNNSIMHKLTEEQIGALLSAQKAITAVELIGLTANESMIKE